MTDTDGNGIINAADCNQPGTPGGGENVGSSGDTTGGSPTGDVLGDSAEGVTPPPVLSALLTVDLVAPTGVEAVVVNAPAAPTGATATRAPEAPARPVTASANTVLAFTGVGTLTLLLAIAAAFMIALGTVLVGATRRAATKH